MDYSRNQELLLLAINGDEAATEELMANNLGLVRSVALRFKDTVLNMRTLCKLAQLVC